MARRVIWSKPAVDDLTRLRQYISAHSPENAKRFVKKLRKEVENLQDFPHLGQVVPEFSVLQLREIQVDRYRVLYLVKDRVEIVRICRKDYPLISFPSENQ